MSLEQWKVQLLEMGFTEEQVNKGLAATKNSGVQPAMEWIFDHPESSTEGGQKLGGEAPPPSNPDQKTTEAVTPSATPLQEEEVVVIPPEETVPKILTEEEKQQAMIRIKQKQEEIRKKRAEEEALLEKEREATRRKGTRELVDVKDKLKQDDMKRAVASKKREKDEEKKARQRVKEKIERNKRERLERTGKLPDESKPAAGTPSPTQPAAPLTYDECAVQIRLTNGSTIQHNFKPDDTLRVVYNWVAQNRTDAKGSFMLLTAYPRKEYSGSSLDSTTLRDAQLVPRGSLMIK